MYKLYGLQGSCSTGIHILLKALAQDFKVIPKNTVDNYNTINPVGAVPALDDGGMIICEGAAIVLYLLEKHKSEMMPTDLVEKSSFIQKLMFNYATMHPAYNRLFFAMNNLKGKTQQEAYEAAAQPINALWKNVDEQLKSRPFVSGEKVTIIDYLLCIYANWGTFFNVDIKRGPNVDRMIKQVIQDPYFSSAFEEEGVEFALFKS